MINRFIHQQIIEKSDTKKAILVFGPRQTGKTTLMHQILDQKKDVLWLSGDETDIRNLFENASSTRLRAVFGNNKVIVIDEAQRIANIGLSLKLVTDQLPDYQIIATGSSAFELANKTQEALTGRKWEFFLFPLSFGEMVAHHGLITEKRMIGHRLIYGSYPEVVVNPGKEKEILKQLTDSYLYKDLLMLEGLKKPAKLVSLLQALAFQVGSEVSYSELGRTVGLDNQTIEKYIDLLEKAYIVFRIGALSRNLRKELKQGRKVYFYDNGIRNALIAQFGTIEMRTDKGALWENYLMSERRKFVQYNRIWTNVYFWRTQDQQEIDYIEERDGKFHAWEFKWNPDTRLRLSRTFSNAYPGSTFQVVTPQNIEDFLGDGQNGLPAPIIPL
ncbi:MAG TPA: ATP-binding protein [Bacteroidales bacterium]|nr:ATP-binding protein [Bacteroidales bacterium]